MTVSATGLDSMQQAVRDVVRLHSGLLLAQGIIMTLLGVAAVIWPQISSVAVDVYVGWVLLFSGAAGLAIMSSPRTCGDSCGHC
jgi:uncharacterized membrane protein HdeD (DUF308 family)